MTKEQVELEAGNSYFIGSQHLGVIEGVVQAMLVNGLRRSRRIEFNHVQHVLKTLKLIPVTEKVIGLSLGSLDSGDTGLFVLCTSPHHIQGDVPTGETKDAKT